MPLFSVHLSGFSVLILVELIRLIIDAVMPYIAMMFLPLIPALLICCHDMN